MIHKYVHTIKEIRELYDRVADCEELLGEIYDIARSNQYESRCGEICKILREVYPRWSWDQLWDLAKYMCNEFEYKNKPKGYYKDPL